MKILYILLLLPLASFAQEGVDGCRELMKKSINTIYKDPREVNAYIKSEDLKIDMENSLDISHREYQNINGAERKLKESAKHSIYNVIEVMNRSGFFNDGDVCWFRNIDFKYTFYTSDYVALVYKFTIPFKSLESIKDNINKGDVFTSLRYFEY